MAPATQGLRAPLALIQYFRADERAEHNDHPSGRGHQTDRRESERSQPEHVGDRQKGREAEDQG